MKIVFNDKAVSDLQDIRAWISQDSPARAERVLQRIFRAVRALDLFPKRGRPGRHPATFELIVPGLPYLVVYQICRDSSEISITAILHMARDRSKVGR